MELRGVEAAEVAERWSFVQNKGQPRWLWHAIDHLPGVVLAYTFGSRADEVVVKLPTLRKPFGLEHFHTDAAGVYERYPPLRSHCRETGYPADRTQTSDVTNTEQALGTENNLFLQIRLHA